MSKIVKAGIMMKESEYKILIFDADDTLFDFKKSERVAFENTMTEFDFDYDEEKHFVPYKKINGALWKALDEGKITQKELKVERFRQFGEALSLIFDPVIFAKRFMFHLSEASFLYDESYKLVEALHKKYRLGIITNGLTDVQVKRIRGSVIAHFFETIIISEEVGVSKPEPQIYELLLEEMDGVNKDKVLMIGDSIASDIRGGYNFGIDTCWYNANNVMNQTEVKPTYEIQSLLQLYDLLD